MLAHQGQFYFFYTLNQTVHLATSGNLDHWTPSARNPVATLDGKHYVGSDFRDPFVFYNEEESCWWMLVAAEVPGPARFRAGCVGLYKSPNLLDWQAAEPLWAPGLGPRQECPQVIRHQGRWYLFDIERQDQYRVAKSLAGPWMRPPSRYLGPHTVLCGSRLGSDGKRWLSFPFLCAHMNHDIIGGSVRDRFVVRSGAGPGAHQKHHVVLESCEAAGVRAGAKPRRAQLVLVAVCFYRNDGGTIRLNDLVSVSGTGSGCRQVRDERYHLLR